MKAKMLFERLYIIIFTWALVLLIILCATTFIIRGEGPCMLPTIPEKAILICTRVTHHRLRCGQIIVFRHDGEVIIKRIVSLEGGIYVLGDNPDNSYDSREIGFIPYKDVVGIVLNY